MTAKKKIRVRIPEYGLDIITEDKEAVANLIRGLTKPWKWRERSGFEKYDGKEHIVPAFDPDAKVITEKVD
jgi:hypothetical protein